MIQYEQICGLLEEKRLAFIQYEKETQALYLEHAERLEEHMSNRERLIGRIDGLDEQLKGLCGGDQLALDAVWNRCPREGLDSSLARIFDAAQEIFAIANRVRNAEIQAAGRMEGELAKLDKKIRELNRSVEAQASKYLSATAAMESRPYRPMGSGFGSA